jgi:hypothetical protein
MSESLVTRILGARDMSFHRQSSIAVHGTGLVRGEIIFGAGKPVRHNTVSNAPPSLLEPALTQLQLTVMKMCMSNRMSSSHGVKGFFPCHGVHIWVYCNVLDDL